MDGGPAETAGVATGDVITDVDGAPVGSIDALLRALAGAVTARELTLSLRRAGASLRVAVKTRVAEA